jgi:hypothetical protein
MAMAPAHPHEEQSRAPDQQAGQASVSVRERRLRERQTYRTLAAVVLTSMVAIYLLSYSDVVDLSHITFSEERLYITLLMGAAVAIIMVAFMWGTTLTNRRVNLAVVVGAAVVGLLALWLARSQSLVDDQSYMRSMIPHQSSSVLTSERAGIEDIRVRALADQIIEEQRQEIATLKWLIGDIKNAGIVTTVEEAEERPVPDLDATP